MTQYEPLLLADLLRESIQQGTVPSLTVTSSSMAPLLRTGDQVGLQFATHSNLRSGQIITFANPADKADLITHRVAGVIADDEETKILTYGDRSLIFDAPVTTENVIGRVIWRRRNGRVLDLDHGKGAWLSERLALQAKTLRQRMTGLSQNACISEPQLIERSNFLCRRNGRRVGGCFFRLVSVMWASIITYYVDSVLYKEA